MAVIGVSTILTGCSQKKWHVEGELANGADMEIVVEAPNGRGGWYAIDTVSTNSKGIFKAAGNAIGHPEVLRLTLNGESLYFPIDSLETIKVLANADAFGSDYQVGGSDSADKLQLVNSLIAKTVKEKGAELAAVDPDLKRQLAEVVLRDPSGAVAYYTIFRRIGNLALFDPTQKSDLRIIGAVANAFNISRPVDSRTKFLETYYLGNKKNLGGTNVVADTLLAREIQLPEIALLDNKGTSRSLTDEASHGNVVILNFTSYSADESPAFNLELAKVYDANHANGLEIYQVAFDEDEFQWRQAAANLPWITVYNSPAAGDAALRDYNVRALPALFIINRKGELVERITSISQLSSAVARYM